MALYARETPKNARSKARTVQRPEISEEQRTEIKEAFDLFDGNKDGALNHHEFKVALRALGFDIKKPEIRQIMLDYDKKGNGAHIEYLDFAAYVSDLIKARDPLEEVRRAFRLFDDDGTGKISLRNLKRVAKELGETLDEGELQSMIEEFDLDADGEINEHEFINIMTEEL